MTTTTITDNSTSSSEIIEEILIQPSVDPKQAVEDVYHNSSFYKNFLRKMQKHRASTSHKGIVSRRKQQNSCQKNFRREFSVEDNVYLQSNELYERFSSICRGRSFDSADFDYFIKLLEDVLMTTHHIIMAKTKIDYTLCVVNFVKLRSSGPVISSGRLATVKDQFNIIFGAHQLQSDDMFAKARQYTDKFQEVRHAPIFKKLYKFSMYLLASSLFEGVGLSFNNLNYKKVEEEAIRREYGSKVDLVACLLDTTLFLCERGHQCMVTGTLDPIMHSGDAYEKWYTKVQQLKLDALVLGNPDPHMVDPFNFLADLNEAIEKGDAIYKHAIALGDFERKTVRGLLNDLKIIKSNETSKRSAQKRRTAPFSVLIYGGSGVAKSKFTEMLFVQYGKLFNLNTSTEFMYTRNSIDPFWSGFSTSQWCGLLDDVGFMHPNIAVGGDPTLMEMIQVINDIPLVPNQAALEDKGRTPVRFKFVMATTNAQNLNAYAYFSSPLAAQRRLPWVIDLKPKKQYLRDGCMIDTSKLPPTDDGCYPDFWDIEIKKVVPRGQGRDNQTAGYETIHIFDNIKDFIFWFSKTALDYEDLQKKSTACSMAMSVVTICKTCFLPNKMCHCVSPDVSVDASDVDLQTGDIRYRVSTDGEIIAYPHKPRRSDFKGVLQAVSDDEDDNTNLNIDQREEIQIYENAVEHLRVRKAKSWRENFYDYMFLHIIDFFLTLYFEWSIFKWGASWLYTFPIIQKWFKRVSSTTFADSRVLSKLLKKMGNNVHKKIGKVRILHAIAGFITASATLYIAIKLIRSYFSNSEAQTITWVEMEGANQSKQNSIGTIPVADEVPRTNVWIKDDYETTTFDVSKCSISYKGLERSQVESILLKNCVMLFSTSGEGLRKPTKAIGIGGHVYLCNSHGLPKDDTFDVLIIQTNPSTGVTSNVSVKISQSDIYRSTNDKAYINIRDIPPKRDITALFCTPTLRGRLKGVYLGRDRDGSIFRKPVENIFRVMVKSTIGEVDSWRGLVDNPTVNGDCGSILLTYTDFGPIILGIHYLGGENEVYSLAVTCEDVVEGLNHFGIVVQAHPPELQSISVKRGLIELHPKSAVRYIPDGSANVYGSFTGFRARLKSRVQPTLICDTMLKHGYKIQNTKPCMDWKPWNRALLDMTKPATALNSTILDECVQGFTTDILRDLPLDELHKIHVYNKFTAINGAAGVAYVDKINRNTSAGCPWKTSKKFFEISIDPRGDLLDPIDYNNEISDRIDLCIDRYIKGYRYMPVFCGNLKDEAVSFQKFLIGKTRVFAGAPLDWTITVRMYLLSFIRVAQNNRFIFECAPGTIAQSLEWQQIRDYLTKFGESNIVAGDYAKFDKSMCAKMILAAYQVIENICRAAGYSDEELQIIKGIAEDTAFPLMDFNGDLIEFFGSNPSGHPLTVIINGIANSLYMRYAYHVLSENHTCLSFKEYVALMTYGDDNAMGVSKLASFFNHSNIKRVLADVGVKYTMADKEAESVPYIHIDECSFLKRTWRWDVDVKAYLCPLDHASIEKMLTIGVKSKTITEESQCVSIILTAVREYFFYGKEVFEEKSAILKQAVIDANLSLYVHEAVFPSWDQLHKDFRENSKHVKLRLQSSDEYYNPAFLYYMINTLIIGVIVIFIHFKLDLTMHLFLVLLICVVVFEIFISINYDDRASQSINFVSASDNTRETSVEILQNNVHHCIEELEAELARL